MNPEDQNDAGLRALLHDAVADVHPADGLDAIREQSRKVLAPRRRGWLVGTTAAAVATAAVIVGVIAVSGRAGDDPATGPAANPTSTPATESVTVPVFYVGTTPGGPRLFKEMHRVRSGPSVDDSALTVAVNAAMTTPPDNPTHRTLFAPGAHATAERQGDAVRIDLEPAGGVGLLRKGVTRAEAEAALQAIVYTATSVAQGTQTVAFDDRNGTITNLFGVAVNQGLARESADSILAPVSIDDPAWGATVSSPLTVDGMASTFEANVVWELKQGKTIVKHGFTTARECCTLSPYSFTVKAPPGRYTLVVHDTDDSGAGGPVNQDSKDITVR